MKKHHYWMIGVVVLEMFFLGITNKIQYKKELSASLLLEKQEYICNQNDFTIPLSSNHFRQIMINQQERTALSGQVRNGRLNLSFKDLKRVPNNLVSLITHTDCIKQIYFSQNYIDQFPEAIAHFPNAKKVDLSYNRLESLEFVNKNIQFDQVEELILSGNPMIRINDNITKFPNLKKLYLENMPNLEDISEDIKKLEKLKIIVIRDSPIGSNRNKIIKLNRWLNKNEIRVYWKSRRN
ncbi:MAG: leucine-rich repeat domain-containing protein [Saprospiraceae bacterium]